MFSPARWEVSLDAEVGPSLTMLREGGRGRMNGTWLIEVTGVHEWCIALVETVGGDQIVTTPTPLLPLTTPYHPPPTPHPSSSTSLPTPAPPTKPPHHPHPSSSTLPPASTPRHSARICPRASPTSAHRRSTARRADARGSRHSPCDPCR